MSSCLGGADATPIIYSSTRQQKKTKMDHGSNPNPNTKRSACKTKTVADSDAHGTNSDTHIAKKRCNKSGDDRGTNKRCNMNQETTAVSQGTRAQSKGSPGSVPHVVSITSPTQTQNPEALQEQKAMQIETSSTPIPMSFHQAVQIQDTDELRDHIQKCNDAYEDAKDGQPVAVFTDVTEANANEAFTLYEENTDSRMRIDFANDKLWIIETPTNLHDIPDRRISSDIYEYLIELGLHRSGSFISNVGTGKEHNMEPDAKIQRMSFTHPAGPQQTILAVEVAWSQELGSIHEKLTLLGKARRWIKKAKVPLVLAVKLYGYNNAEGPGMLVFLVNNAVGVHQVFRAGTIPDGELNLLAEYNRRHPGNAFAAPLPPTMIAENVFLEIQGDVFLGLGTGGEEGREKLNSALRNLEDLEGQMNDMSRGDLMAAINTLLERHVNGGYGVVRIHLMTLYKDFFHAYNALNYAQA